MKKLMAVILALLLITSLCASALAETAPADAEAPDDVVEVNVVLPEDNGLAGVFKSVEMENYGMPTYLFLWDDGIGSIDLVGTGTVRGVFYNDETMQIADEGTVPQKYSYADDKLTWTYTDEQGEHVSTFVRLTAEERAAYEELGVGTVVEKEDKQEEASPWPEDNGDLVGVYKWAEMEDIGVKANLIIWEDGIGLIDLLGVVEIVSYDDQTMQSSGEGAVPQSYTYADGTLTWTVTDQDGEHVSTFVKLTPEELAEYQERGIGNAE